MSYWKIQNDGVAPVECLTLLGLSTARGVENKIGQFGTGCKHGINILLRAGLDVIFFLGKDKLTFFAQPKKLASGKVYNQICYELVRENGQEEMAETSMTLDFGEIDWTTNIQMALREFVSNAIDAGGALFEKVKNVEPQEGKTSVFISDTTETTKYFLNIGEYFLHFTDRQNMTGPIPKIKEGVPSLYRRGVFVRKVGNKTGLFDYNVADMAIDESRNLNDWHAEEIIMKAVATSADALKTILAELIAGNSAFYEADLRSLQYYVNSTMLKKAWKELCGDKAVCEAGMLAVIQGQVSADKYVLIQSRSFYEALKKVGVQTVLDLCVGKVSSKGHKNIKPTPDARRVFNKVWLKLTRLGLTLGKEKPNLSLFSKVNTDETCLRGYYDRETKTVFINEENPTSVQTIFEELVHHITGAADCSRNYQEYVNSVVAAMISK